MVYYITGNRDGGITVAANADGGALLYTAKFQAGNEDDTRDQVISFFWHTASQAGTVWGRVEYRPYGNESVIEVVEFIQRRLGWITTLI